MSEEVTPEEEAAAARRRAARNAIKLAALVASKWGVTAEADTVGTGASVAHGSRVFVLVEGDHGLGTALARAWRTEATEIHVIADEQGPTIARQAALFRSDLHVWRSVGRDLEAVEPEPLAITSGPPDAPELVALLESEGLDVVVEGDRLAGEFRGLEVVRIVRAVDDGEPILEVGVGRYDRTMTAMMHGDLDGRASIARVVSQLREIRRPGGPVHPLASLVPERWLRSTLIADPSIIGCDQLVAAPSAEPRDRLRPHGIASTVGTHDGAPVVVACSVGVDIEAPVRAADTRAMLDPGAELVLVTPARDVLPVTEALVADVRGPSTIIGLERDWRT